jgi:diguanylate cyclase (GGDEF)-like protein
VSEASVRAPDVGIDRNRFLAALARQLASHRDKGAVLGLLLVKLEGLRRANARFGYGLADQLIAKAGARLSGVVRDQDEVHRVSGSEFALILTDLRGEGHAQLAAAKLTRVFEFPLEVEAQAARIPLSIGIAMFPQHAEDAEGLWRRAELALAAARDSLEPYLLYSLQSAETLSDAWQLQGELDRAIRDNELLLEFQPKLQLNDNQPIGVEALVRWQHPQRGLLGPDRFIPLAQQSGHIHELGWWVLNSALRQCAEWQIHWPELTLAVNLSARTLEHPELAERLESALRLWGVDPGQLILEVTESTAMLQGGRGFGQLHALRDSGVQIAIDDFGTGYSSLSYFREMPADEVKIDRSFVAQMAEQQGDHSLVLTIVQLAHNFGLKVVAEGIENDAARQQLLQMDCDIGQGFYFARPMTGSRLMDWLQQWAADRPAADR